MISPAQLEATEEFCSGAGRYRQTQVTVQCAPGQPRGGYTTETSTCFYETTLTGDEFCNDERLVTCQVTQSPTVEPTAEPSTAPSADPTAAPSCSAADMTSYSVTSGIVTSDLPNARPYSYEVGRPDRADGTF